MPSQLHGRARTRACTCACAIGGGEVIAPPLAAADGVASKSVDEIAYGYLQVANEAMCRPIRALTQMKGAMRWRMRPRN